MTIATDYEFYVSLKPVSSKDELNLESMKRLLFLIIAIVSVNLVNAQEAKYKALFMANFTKYIEWPAADLNGDFVICVVNQNEVLNQLKTFTTNKFVGSHPISVVGVKSIDDITKCNILYLSFAESKADKIEAVLGKLSGTSTLVLTDRPGSLKNGSCINFLLVDDKLKFEINEPAISERKLQISAQLRNQAVQ